MNKLNLGVIGVGHMGHYHANVMSGIHPNIINFAGIFDTDKKKAKIISDSYAVKAFNDLDEFLKNIDAVVIAAPTTMHYEISKKVLEKGKHIIIEKPITTTIKEAEELVNLAAKNDLILQVGHVERFNGAVQELKNIIQNPFLWEARRMGPNPKRSLDIGVVLDLMIHDIDICLNVVNSDVEAINAYGKSVFSPKFEDVANAQIFFKNGCIANITASRITQEKIRSLSVSQIDSYIYLDFTTQDLHIHRQASSMTTTSSEKIKYRQEALIERLFVHKENPLKCQLLHFINTITGKEKPNVSNIKDIETLRITNQIMEQIKNQL